jgi:hypothetical protein
MLVQGIPGAGALHRGQVIAGGLPDRALTGMVLGLQDCFALVRFGSRDVLGTAVASSLVRELGPVLIAFMLIARGGSHGRIGQHAHQ